MELMLNGVTLGLAVLVLGMLGWVLRSNKISRWSIVVVVVLGLVVCITAAIRDGYGFSSTAVLEFTGLPALLFSLAGVTLLGLCGLALIHTSQVVRRFALAGVTGLFIVKLVAMELIRILG